MKNDILPELTSVIFSTAEAQLRYLQRLEERCYQEFMASSVRNFQTAHLRWDAAASAVQNFSPETHAEVIRTRNMTA
jgi:hypothetical protein